MSAILKRELMNYFLTPIGYIYTGVFVLMNAFFLVTGPLRYGAADMRALFSNSNAVFMFLTAILTMRLLSEERGKKTDQLLLTSPVSVWEIVIGKYLAAVCVFLTALAISLCMPAVLFIFGSPSVTECIGGYFGFILLWSSFIAAGLFISSLTESQTAAAVFTFAALMFINYIDYIASGVSNETLKSIISAFSFYKRYADFEAGILNVSGVVFYLSAVFLFLFLTVKTVERRRYA